jgi:hypothetical protein
MAMDQSPLSDEYLRRKERVEAVLRPDTPPAPVDLAGALVGAAK